MNPRAVAARILLQVMEDHRSLPFALAGVDFKNAPSGLIKELCFGVCRWYFRLAAIADCLLDKPLKAKDHDIDLLILLGLYQILYLRVPEHAAVLETVEAARALNKPWATRLINGVLRSFLRQKEALLASVDNTLIGRYAHPQWMVDAILTAWPQQWEAILAANNQHPPLCLRVNKLQITAADYLKSLANAGINATAVDYTAEAVILEQAGEVTKLPGFYAGQFSVQDSAPQLAASLLMLEPGQRVLDACAAPGGKTTHIMEVEPKLAEIIAVDKDDERLEKVKQNIQRLQLTTPIAYKVADATQTREWWDGVGFERILVDAPCSGTGVIRRHPDIKHLREPQDIAASAAQQQALLKALWPLLKPQGILLYATCSIFPQENAEVIRQFLMENADAKEQPIVASWGIATQPGRQILTGEGNSDGFYYARLLKTPL